MSLPTVTQPRIDITPALPQRAALRILRILVLPRDGGRPLFHYEPSAEERQSPDPGPPEADPAGRGIRARMSGVLDRVRHLEQNVPERLRAPLAWLKSRLPGDERLLMALRRADGVALVHPTSLTAAEAEAAWTTYLDERFRRRLFWLIFYVLILVPSIMLAVLPGPNVVGFWVTYRLVAHGLALASVVRASKGKVRVATRPSGLLDGPYLTDRRQVERIQEHFGLVGLKARLKRIRVFNRLRKRRRKAAEPDVRAGGDGSP